MKLITLLTISCFICSYSLAGNSYRQTCLTHGECQEANPIEEGHKCLIVKTGVDAQGKLTCSLKCYRLTLGSFCKKSSNEQIGFCTLEAYQVPEFDPSNPNCENAIDPIQ